jgi:uncharacterized membrane protein YhaH (DUF805 family)
MEFGQAIKSVFSKYATFAGRAPRSEFWFWILFTTLAGAGAGILDRAVDVVVGYDEAMIAALWGLATIVPFLAVSVRRLHDTDRTGWWLLLFFVPFFGGVVLIVWFCTKGTKSYNRFGPDYFRPGGYVSRRPTA